MSKNKQYTARTADKHFLYQNSVQAADRDARYFDRLYKRFRGKKALVFKEDFCGTAALSCEWAKLHRQNQSIGVDLCQSTLEWGIEHNLSELSPHQLKRICLIKDDVLNVTKPQVDILAAMNFSYFIFKTRDKLRRYFQAAHKSLQKDGLLVLDVFGGWESQEEMEEPRQCEGFVYVWEHAQFNPVTNEILCNIHFEFKDGSRLRKAFTYDWRLWSLPEIQELLHEAGFTHAEVHWEGTDQHGDGNGIFRKTTKGEAIESWIAYILALP